MNNDIKCVYEGCRFSESYGIRNAGMKKYLKNAQFFISRRTNFLFIFFFFLKLWMD